MDKKDVKDSIKLITMLFLFMLGIMFIPLTLIESIKAISQGLTVIDMFKEIFKTAKVFFALFIVSVYLVIIIVYFLIKRKRKKEMTISNEYFRDLPEYFPPAIASFLLDLSIEITTDYSATIAYLISKKYIVMNDNKFEIINNDISNLSEHEKYVLNCITKKEKLNNEKFKSYVLSDAKKMGLITEGKRTTHFWRNFFIALTIAFSSAGIAEIIKEGIIYKFFIYLYDLAMLSLFIIIPYSIYLANKYCTENFFRTNKGKLEGIKWRKFKNFLKDYTLLNNKNFSDITIFEDYIPYAIALNEAKSIEKYIEENNNYRKLIYGNTNEIIN